MIPRLRSSARQFETHQQLVGRTRPASDRRSRRLDAIVVPASRPAASLASAVALAADVGCELLALCSRDAQAAEVTELFAERDFRRGLAVEIPAGYKLPIRDFASSRFVQDELPLFCHSPNGDLSVKRNIGLLVGRMLGWRSMFFMDDDIRGISTEDLFATVDMLGGYNAAGMRVTDFPDNSVVCHAHRETGGAQDIFVSGSVLAVDPRLATGFFPDVYNEDWLFFHEDARAGRLGCSGRNAAQLPYDPFAKPGRATRQEFGDVLAEGLYALLHEGAGVAEAEKDYWLQFLKARKKFLVDVNFRAGIADAAIRSKLIIAVETAMQYLDAIEASMFVGFIRAWQRDLRYWTQVMEAVRPSSSLRAALQRLKLEPASGNQAPVIARVKAIPISTVRQRPKLPDNRLLRGRHRKAHPDLRTVRSSAPDGNRVPTLPVGAGSSEHEAQPVPPGAYQYPEVGALARQARTAELERLQDTDPDWQADATFVPAGG